TASLPYYSMKWVEGGSLADRIEQFRGRPREAVELLLTVARAVQHAHERGILHRDLKPANILMASGGCEPPGAMPGGSHPPLADLVPYVSDFGLAKRLAPEAATGSRTSPAAPTLPGVVLGTPSYMAPEQARDARNATVAADVYSLGAILYELLTGRPPFRAASYLETVLDVLERQAPTPRSTCPGLGRDLDPICLKCLDKAPGRRYVGAAALADDLERYLNGQPIQARPVGRMERFTRWCRRQPVVAALSAAIVVSVLAGVALVFTQWRRAEDSLEQARQDQERAEEQRQLADERFRKAWEVIDRFHVRLSEERLSQYPGLQPLRKELLEQGLAYMQDLLRTQALNPRLKLELADVSSGIGQIS